MLWVYIDFFEVVMGVIRKYADDYGVDIWWILDIFDFCFCIR